MANETDYKTVIKIEGDSAGAQNAIGRTANALKGLLAPLKAVRSAIGAVMSAMGVFYLAAEGFRIVVNAIKSLREWLNRGKRCGPRGGGIQKAKQGTCRG